MRLNVPSALAAEEGFLRPVSVLSSAHLSAVVSALRAETSVSLRHGWYSAVAALVSSERPDMYVQVSEFLGVEAAETNWLSGMSIGEIGAVYEALTALLDRASRKKNGQFFTPDDVASHLAANAHRFPPGRWLDPCSGVGNLSWHLAATQGNSAAFVKDSLTLIEMDPVALKTAVVLLASEYAAPDDTTVLPALAARAQERNFLDAAPLPDFDYAIFNPPYGRTERNDRFESADTSELSSYFMERISEDAKGFIAITPAAYLNGSKYGSVRHILNRRVGGEVFVFDNMPDTIFRGYKYGSTNTSKTNLVRAAITVSAPDMVGWKVSPIIRWTYRNRERMFANLRSYLTDRSIGPDGEWTKLMPGTEWLWELLAGGEPLSSIVSKNKRSPYFIEVASTPRYYISASRRCLSRSNKHVLFFDTEEARDWAYVLLNSSLPYWWWRTLDGGINLPLRVLLSLPLPPRLSSALGFVSTLVEQEESQVVVKMNAGRENENVKRPRGLVEEIDRALLGVSQDWSKVYASDMFTRDSGVS